MEPLIFETVCNATLYLLLTSSFLEVLYYIPNLISNYFILLLRLKMSYTGYIRDVTGGYAWCFYGMGSCMVLGSIPVIIFHLFYKDEDRDSSVD